MHPKAGPVRGPSQSRTARRVGERQRQDQHEVRDGKRCGAGAYAGAVTRMAVSAKRARVDVERGGPQILAEYILAPANAFETKSE